MKCTLTHVYLFTHTEKDTHFYTYTQVLESHFDLTITKAISSHSQMMWLPHPTPPYPQAYWIFPQYTHHKRKQKCLTHNFILTYLLRQYAGLHVLNRSSTCKNLLKTAHTMVAFINNNTFSSMMHHVVGKSRGQFVRLQNSKSPGYQTDYCVSYC